MSIVTMISGSPSERSTSSKVLEYVGAQLTAGGTETKWISVKDFSPEDLLRGNVEHAPLRESFNWLDASDAVVVATPVYKASYTGLLKAYLDLLPQTALKSKVVLPIAVGGAMAHLLMIDYAFKPVLYALDAQFVLAGVYCLDTQVTTNADGSTLIDESIRRRLDGGIEQLIATVRSSRLTHAI